MTIYDGLRQDYEQWSTTNREYWFGSARYAVRFASGFREYLGAPEFFDDNGKKQAYVEVRKVTEDENGEPHFESANFHEVLSVDDERSSLAFGIVVMLEIAANTFPKGSFAFSIGMVPRGNLCTLRISGEEFNVDMSGDKSRLPAYEHMAKVVRDFLALKPWDAQRKQPIGFVNL